MNNWLVWDNAINAQYPNLNPTVRSAVAHAIAATSSWYALDGDVNIDWHRVDKLIEVYSD